uniref:Uncharacterized protein n=1 Tax=Ditylenchus dipsaci TaxID=166011 RepID=A0A915D822_9BILA
MAMARTSTLTAHKTVGGKATRKALATKHAPSGSSAAGDSRGLIAIVREPLLCVKFAATKRRLTWSTRFSISDFCCVGYPRDG